MNSSRAVAMLILVQLSSASPGGRTARTNVLFVSLATIKLNRGVLMKNSLNWCEDVDEEVKLLLYFKHMFPRSLLVGTYARECLKVLMMLESLS